MNLLLITKFGIRFLRMTKIESKILVDKITKGVHLAFERLLEQTKKEDGELVISKNGKIVRVKARDLKTD